MEVIYKGKNNWLFRDPDGKYTELAVEVREVQSKVYQVHCRLNAFKETRRRPLDFIELRVRPLPAESAAIVDSRPATRRLDKKTPLVWNCTVPSDACWVFYEYKNHEKFLHDCYMTFEEHSKRFKVAATDKEEEEEEDLMLFEVTVAVCFKRNWRQKILGDHNFFLFEPVHVSAVVFN